MEQNQPKRGLNALLQNTTNAKFEVNQTTGHLPATSTVSINLIHPNAEQPRKSFDASALSELAESIRIKGLIQPVIVRKIKTPGANDAETFELIAGERRWRAAKQAGLSEIPVVIKTVSNDTDVLLLSLIENLQREDLNPIEEALAYQRLRTSFSMTQEEISVAVSKSRSSVSNSLRLLELPGIIQDKIKSGELTFGHAKVLLGVEDSKLQYKLAAKCTEETLSVRQLELLVAGKESLSKMRQSSLARSNQRRASAQVKHIETRLRTHFGTKVHIEEGVNKGKLIIEFYSVEDFDRITGLMGLTET